VINNKLNLGFISHRFWDTTTYWLKIADFTYHPLIWRPRSGCPCGTYGKALRILKPESSKQPMVKILWP